MPSPSCELHAPPIWTSFIWINLSHEVWMNKDVTTTCI
jgi:hypothetical protein